MALGNPFYVIVNRMIPPIRTMPIAMGAMPARVPISVFVVGDAGKLGTLPHEYAATSSGDKCISKCIGSSQLPPHSIPYLAASAVAHEPILYLPFPFVFCPALFGLSTLLISSANPYAWKEAWFGVLTLFRFS